MPLIDLTSEDGIERDDRGVPTAIRIWVPGANMIVDGSADIFDDASADLLREQQALGRRYSFDYNHFTFRNEGLADPVTAAEAAGWHYLDVRDNGECWLRVAEWIDPAPERILSKKYLYLSPVFDADESGRIVRYTNCALTNVPMTTNAVALRARAESKTMEIKKILTALGFVPADWEGKTEDEIAEMIRSAMQAAAPAPDSSARALPGTEERGEDGEEEQRADEPEGEQRSEPAPAPAEQQRSAKPGTPRRVTAGFAPAGWTPIAVGKPAPRRATPTTQSGSKNIMRSVGLQPSTCEHSRRRAGLPETAPEVLKLPAHLRISAAKDLVILRNSGDAIHFERSEDEKEMVRAKYKAPRLGR